MSKMSKIFLRAAFAALATHASLVSATLSSYSRRSALNTQPDYVIIGGGPAGFVLAEELSKTPNISVVLLEAGPENAGVRDIDVPGLAPLLLETQYTWNYTSQPDPNLNGNAPPLAQGRGFGGGTAVNYLGLCRGAPSVFDEWADISGDDGLKWENFLNDYMSTVHHKEIPLDYDPHINTSVYGDGPIELTSPPDNLGFVLQLIQTWKNILGLPEVDLNDGTGIGIMTSTDNIRANNRTRDFAPQAYGWQMAGRLNAQQLYNAQVTKIGFNGTRATSVTYVDPTINGTSITLYPKEVILSAGALNSPKVSVASYSEVEQRESDLSTSFLCSLELVLQTI